MIIVSYNSYGELTVIHGSHTYKYIRVSEYTYDKLETLIYQKRYGEAWQLLKKETRLKERTQSNVPQKKYKKRSNKQNLLFPM